MFQLATTAKLKTHKSTGRKDGDQVIPSSSFKLTAMVSVDDVLTLLATPDQQKDLKKVFWNGAGAPIFQKPITLTYNRPIEMHLELFDSFLDDMLDKEKANSVLTNDEAQLVNYQARIAEGHQVELTLNLFMPVSAAQSGELGFRVTKGVYVILTEKPPAPKQTEEGEEYEAA